MAFVLETNRKVLILRLKGTETPKERTVSEVVTSLAERSPFIILDLDNERLSSLGIGTLVNVSNIYQKIWNDNFIPINLYNIHPQLRQLLEVSGLKKQFRVWDNLDDCYKSLGDHPVP